MNLVDEATGWSYSLEEEMTAVGRHPNCDVILSDPSVARRHAQIQRGAGGYVIHDLGSQQGTFVNGRAITSPRPIAPGDVIRVGGSELIVQEQTKMGQGRRGGTCVWVAAALAVVLVVSLATLLIVLVARRGAPEVTLLTPAPGSLARVDDQVYIQAEATDQRGVTRMELWVDDILIGVSQATSSQGDRTLQARQAWTFTYTGTHSIMAVAYNAAGRASQTDRATVEVVPFLISQPTPTPSLTPLPPASPPTFSAPTHAPTPTRVQPTAAPTQPPATATATAPPTATPSGDLEPVIQFWVSPRAIQAGEQATLSWRIENVSAAYLDGEPVSGPFGQKQVSPTTTTLYTLRVLLAGGEEVVQLVTLVVLP